MIRKLMISVTLLIVCTLAGLWVYSEYLRPVRIAVVGFSDTDWANWESAIQKTPYILHRYADDGIDTADLTNYRLVFIRGQGLNLTPEQVKRLDRARSAGTHIYIRTATNALSEQQNSVPPEHREQIDLYMRHGGEQNLIGMAHYAAHHLAGRDVEVPPVVERPQFGFFHLGSIVLETLPEFDSFLVQNNPGIPADAPRIALLAGFADPHDLLNRAPVDAMITALEQGGARVYPVFGRMEAFSLLREVRPDLVLTFPHGRLGTGDSGTRLLKELNCPVVSALPLMSSEEKWMADERGMEGGFLGQSITSPELDGIIEPIVVSSMEPNERRLSVRTPIDEQMQSRVSLALNWLKLRKKQNFDKRLVIVYYKSPGMAALSAGGLEVAPALWNTLKRLESEGYDLGSSVPESPEALFQMIQTKGRTIGQWALGSYEQFLKEAEPELVPAQQYAVWFQKTLSPVRQKETIDLWGDLPGDRMVTNVNGEPNLVISRIQLGKIVIMPQPTVGGGDEGEDEISSIHGTDQAVPHFYLGAYLWARYGFKADAILHFGTHGSLEFTYGKSNCLSRDCWPQILIGDIPHIYPYVINNVGEALVAKRRSNAVIVSHLTPPFMEAGLYGELSLLHDKIHDWEQIEDPLLREETLRSATNLVRELKLAVDLGLDEEALAQRLLSEDELTAVHNYIHQLKDQSVTDGLHVIGRELNDDQIQKTVSAMVGDQGVEQIVQAVQLDDAGDPREYQMELTTQLVNDALSGTISASLLFTEDERKEFDRQEAAENAPDAWSGPTKTGGRPGSAGAGARGNSAGANGAAGADGDAGANSAADPASDQQPARPRSRSVPATNSQSSLQSGNTVAHRWAQPVLTSLNTDESVTPPDNAEEKSPRFYADVEDLKARLNADPKVRRKLYQLLQNMEQNAVRLRSSPSEELNRIVGALNTEYIEPSSGGDPIVNPSSIPTGRNLFSINAEQTPSQEAWRVGMRLTDEMLKAHRSSNGGQYPKQVAISLWGGEFIRSKGTGIAQILFLMGMRPVWNSRGVVHDVEIIPATELGRPRIDVLVQTSGQFRDAAASRISLIDKAVQIVSALGPEEFPNFVREGSEETEKTLKASGVSARDARDFSTARIFGSASNSSYGTQIMGMVEKGDSWEQSSEVADRYINNMSGVYRDGDRWGTVVPGLLEAQLQGVEVVVHPRSSNTWGPMSLDHVYEFMGGITLAVREKTGVDPTGYFSDQRQPGKARVTTSIGAIREEARTTLWNPAFIKGMQKEGPTAAAALTETVRNMYGWNVMQPAAIKQDMWDETYQVYVQDKHDLNMREYFEDRNPYALQDMTSVMLETARKGYWSPDPSVLQNIASLHAELVVKHGAACSYETCGNQSLHEFLLQQLNAPGTSGSPELQSQYQASLNSTLQPSNPLPEVTGIQMEEVQEEVKETASRNDQEQPAWGVLLLCLLLCSTALISESLRRTFSGNLAASR
ncbi:MAG: cobaltochelatase subunit CobN [Planctomyces sp.]|nr:cobaltochelatase subunit CobN [Planctomyces sp.]